MKGVRSEVSGWGKWTRASGGGNNRGDRSHPSPPAHSQFPPPPRPQGQEEPGAGPNCPKKRKEGLGGTRAAGPPTLGAPSQQRRLLSSPCITGTPATILLHPPRPRLRGSLSDPLGSEPRTFRRRAPPKSYSPRTPAPGAFPTLPAALPHQAVLCPPPQESKCRAFPAKTCWRHIVANARSLAVKQRGARSRPGGSVDWQRLGPALVLRAGGDRQDRGYFGIGTRSWPKRFRNCGLHPEFRAQTRTGIRPVTPQSGLAFPGRAALRGSLPATPPEQLAP